MEKLSEFLKNKRFSLKFSLRTAAEKIGISHSYLSNLEKGIDPRSGAPIAATPETLKAIANAYNVSYDSLMKMAGYLSDSEFKPELTVKDNKDLDKVMINFEKGLEGSIMLDGEILDEHTKELFLASVRHAYELAKLNNKAKYTPKKFRK